MKKFLKELINAALIVLGILSAGLGLKGFLLSSHFIDGGVTGISMLLSSVLKFPLAILILIINLPFIGFGLRQIGWKFALRSALAIAGLSVCLAFIHYPDVTSDKVLGEEGDGGRGTKHFPYIIFISHFSFVIRAPFKQGRAANL